MKAVNVDEVLKILYKYDSYICMTDEKKYADMMDEIANLKAFKRCADCVHFGKLSLECGRCDDDCSMYEPEEQEE